MLDCRAEGVDAIAVAGDLSTTEPVIALFDAAVVLSGRSGRW